jgi:hypothetical protein
MTRPHRLPALGLLALLVASATGCGGQRLLEARVERDGELVLKALFSVPDSMSPAEAWKQLEGRTFTSVGSIQLDDTDPKKALLRGKIRVALTHTGNPFASAEVENLRVVRPAGAEHGWEIPKEELDRAAKAAGY